MHVCDTAFEILAYGGNLQIWMREEWMASLPSTEEACQGRVIGMAVALHGAWGWYKMQLAARPLRTQIISSSLIWAAGDVLAQFISHCESSNARFSFTHPAKHASPVSEEAFNVDWRRVLTLGFFGAAFVAPVGHWWYESLDYVVSNQLNLPPGSIKLMSAKLAADTLILGPVHLLAFLTYMGVASGKNLEEIKEMLRKDFVPAYITEGAFWPLVQAFNFRYVPVEHQLLYVNGFCFVDSVFLSWFKYQEDAQWKKWLLSLVTPKHP
ncbi:hypothetical protein KP509_06G044700 [Ceratopteris richardii]|uniref:Uncharacterized protein n=1 Tax=Ceratopteris richardii TaxID=49495 RepID=A0A8T2UNA4_CERRI|nr:hypothetical protein KP509_06G044700 [Ceratopteris richardii]